MPIDNLSELGNDLRNIESVFKEKIEPYRSDLWKYCYKLTRSPWDAEDLVQDTLLRSFSVLAKLYQPINTKAYLFKIATNLWIDRIRKKKDLDSTLDENLVQDKTTFGEFHVIENLEFLIQQLTPIQYVSIILVDVLQFKGKEVAEILGATEGAVHTNLSRARGIMRHTKEDISEINLNKVKPVRDIPSNKVIEILLQGFRKKDPEIIASILDENIITDITHSGLEMGMNETEKNSLRDWKEIADKQHLIVSKYIELWGRPVVIELERKEDNQLYLNNVHYVEIIDSKMTYWKFYCFSWDLMNYAAEALEVKLNAKYFYHIF